MSASSPTATNQRTWLTVRFAPKPEVAGCSSVIVVHKLLYRDCTGNRSAHSGRGDRPRFGTHQRITAPICVMLLLTCSLDADARAFFGHRTFHQQHHRHEQEHHRGQQPKDIEIGQRGCLLLAQILECLQRQLLRSSRISGLLQETRLSLLKEGLYCWSKWIEVLAEPQRMELIAPFLHGLRPRRSNAASLITQKTQ